MVDAARAPILSFLVFWTLACACQKHGVGGVLMVFNLSSSSSSCASLALADGVVRARLARRRVQALVKRARRGRRLGRERSVRRVGANRQRP